MSPQADTKGIREPGLDEWQYHFSEILTKGEDASMRSELIKEGGVIDAENVFFRQGRVTKDFGYVSFGPAVRGNPRFEEQFFRTDGTSELTLVTDATLYTWVIAVSEWHYVSDGNDTTLSVASAATDLTLDVVSDTGFSDGDFIGLLLDDGTQHQTTVNGAPAANVITITDAVPSAAAIGNYVRKAVDFAGDASIPVSVVTWAAKNRMYIANGVDTPRWYDGSTCEIIASLPGSTFSCRIVRLFNDYLILLHTVEDGTAYPQRERWANAGFDDQWNASVNFIDFYQNEDWITSAEALGPYFIIYKERGIIRQSFLGEVDKTWETVQTIDGEGAVSADAVVNLGDAHIVFGNSNIYEYSGDFDLDPIGDEVYDKIFGIEGTLNIGGITSVFLVYVEELDEVWCFIPTNTETVPKECLRYKVATRAWAHRVWPLNFIGFGFYQAQSGLRWLDVVGTWQDQTTQWVRKAFLDNAPITHLCSSGDNQVYAYDYVATDDAGTAIAYKFETQDYYNPTSDLRFDRFDFSLFGTNILIEYSTDKGTTWTQFPDGIVSPGANYIKVSLWKQFVAARIRFRFSGDETFGLEWFGMKFKAESTRL